MTIIDGKAFTQVTNLNVLDTLLVQQNAKFFGTVVFIGDINFDGIVQITPGPLGIGTNDDITDGSILDVRGQAVIPLADPTFPLNFPASGAALSIVGDQGGLTGPDISIESISTIAAQGAFVDFNRTVGTSGALVDNDSLGGFRFKGNHGGVSYASGAKIEAISTGTWSGSSFPVDLVFSTTSSGASLTEAMRLTTGGNLGIGTNDDITDGFKLDIRGKTIMPFVTPAFPSQLPDSATALWISGDSTVNNGPDIVIESLSNTGITGPNLVFARTGSGGGAVLDNDVIGAVAFAGNTSASYDHGGRIDGVAAGNWSTSSRPVDLDFYTTPVSSTNAVNRMRIASTGFVGIGEVVPKASLHVRTAASGANPSGDDTLVLENAADVQMSLLTSNFGEAKIFLGTESVLEAASLSYDSNVDEIALILDSSDMFTAASNSNNGFDIGIGAQGVFESLPIGGTALTLGDNVTTPGQFIIPRAGATPTHIDTNFGFPARDAVIHARGTNSLMSDVFLDHGSNTAASSSGINMRRYRDGGAQLLAGDRLAHITAVANNGTDFFNVGLIECAIAELTTATSTPSFWDFHTTPTGTTAAVRRMRIDETGFVGIGTDTTDPESLVHIKRGTSTGPTPTSSSTALYIESDQENFIKMSTIETKNSGLLFGNNSSLGRAGIAYDGPGDFMGLVAGNTDRVIIEADGETRITAAKLAIGQSSLGAGLTLECQSSAEGFKVPVVAGNTQRDAISAVNTDDGIMVYVVSQNHLVIQINGDWHSFDTTAL